MPVHWQWPEVPVSQLLKPAAINACHWWLLIEMYSLRPVLTGLWTVFSSDQDRAWLSIPD